MNHESCSSTLNMAIYTCYIPDCEQGNCLNLAQIQTLVDEDMFMQDLSKAKKVELIEDLKAYCDLKRTRVHVSNAATVLHPTQGTLRDSTGSNILDLCSKRIHLFMVDLSKCFMSPLMSLTQSSPSLNTILCFKITPIIHRHLLK